MLVQDELNLTHAVIICGNDGTGKTSTAAILNDYFKQKKMPYYVFQRSTNPGDPHLKQLKDILSPKQIDNTTFIYPFEQRPKLPQKISFMGKQLSVQWIMLDAQLETIQKRIRNRSELSIYEVRKCLQYYKIVYREMAYYYGIPLIPTDSKNQLEVSKSIVQIIQSGRDGQIHKLKLEGLKAEQIFQNNKLFNCLLQTTDYRLYEIKNQDYKPFEILVFPQSYVKMLMINRQLLHRNNIAQNIICINHNGVALRYKQNNNPIGAQINVINNPFLGSYAKLNIGFYLDNEQFPLDKDALAQVISVEQSVLFLLRSFATFKFYAQKIGCDIIKLFIKSNHNILNSVIKKQDICFSEKDTELVYSRFEQYLLKNRFHLTQLLTYNIYPYQTIAAKLFNENNNYKHQFKELSQENLDDARQYFYDQKSPNCWISANFIRSNGSEMVIQKYQERQPIQKSIINYKKYFEQTKQLNNAKSLIVHLQINRKLQTLEQQGVLKSSVDILNQLANHGIQSLSVKILQEEESNPEKINQTLLELMIYLPRRITRVYLRNQVYSLEQLRYFWSIGRIIPNTSLLHPTEVLGQVLRFDSKGSIPVKVNSKTTNLQDSIFLNEKIIRQLVDSRQLKLRETIYSINSLLLSHDNKRVNLSIQQNKQRKDFPNTIIIGVSAGKYHSPIDKFIEEHLGIKLVRAEKPRQMLVQYYIEDMDKYYLYFRNKEVSFILMKSKDLPYSLEAGLINACITYSPVLDNSKTLTTSMAETVYPNISVGLIKRNNEVVDPSSWTRQNPAQIATQHPTYVRQYFDEQSIKQDTYELHPVIGCSQSYLVGDTQSRFILCDAVIETGSTMKINNLEVWKTIKEKGSIKIGFYQI